MEYFASVCKFRGWSRISLCLSTPKFGILLKSGFQIWTVTVDRVLRQCFGEKSIFFNNATNELLFGRKHCFYDLNIKMVHFCTFIMRLLWKLGKIAAILDSRRRKKRSQFWIFCYQIFNISKKLQYLQTDQRDFWNFEKKSIFLIFCQKWHKNMRFFIVFRIPFQN